MILEGRGKIKNYREKLGLLEVDVESHCLGHSVLLSMSLNEKSELYQAFMAGFDRYLKVIVQDQLIEIENSCQVLSQNDEIKKYSMKKLQINYLEEKNFGLVVYSQKFGKIERVYFERKINNVVLFHNDNHFDVIQNLGLFLHGRKMNFCSRCFEKVKDANNHVCYDQFNCFKCKQLHPVNSSFEGHMICPLCNCAFDNLFCLNSHYKKSLVVGIKNFEGKKKISPCDLYCFCTICCSVVRKFYYVNSKGTKKKHDCSITYCKICETKRPSVHNCFLLVKKRGKLFYTKNFDEKCEVYVFDFETDANPENLGIFKGYFVAIYKFCNVCMNDMSRGSLNINVVNWILG